ncbi:hypothetical protein R6Z07F_003631 [Ovis aries]
MGQVLLSSRSSRWTPGLYLEGAKSPHCAPSSAPSRSQRATQVPGPSRGPFKCSPAGRHRGQHRAARQPHAAASKLLPVPGPRRRGGRRSARGPAQIAGRGAGAPPRKWPGKDGVEEGAGPEWLDSWAPPAGAWDAGMEHRPVAAGLGCLPGRAPGRKPRKAE